MIENAEQANTEVQEVKDYEKSEKYQRNYRQEGDQKIALPE